MKEENENSFAALKTNALQALRGFLCWMIAGLIIGIAGGIIGAVFHSCIDFVTEFRSSHAWVIYLLPVVGAVIALLYRLTRLTVSANEVLAAVRTRQELPVITLPVIFLSTVLTQFAGGSAGKEGAAIQMGGAIGYQMGKLFHLDEKDRHVTVMCGLAAVFAAVFGTPVTAAFFALEVISIGEMYYVALIPCMAAVFAASRIAALLGIAPLAYEVAFPAPGLSSAGAVILLAMCCAAVSIGFCTGLHRGSRLAKKIIPHDVLRAVIGGCLLIGMTLLSRGTAYNGAGFNLITAAMNGDARFYTFAVKILFTVITISFGFKGGEIVPTMAIGATLGCAVARLTGTDPAFLAAIGLISMFCAMVNCPAASILMGVELFGAEGLIWYAAACTVSFALSGNYSLYSSQKILYSKLRAEYINATAKE